MSLILKLENFDVLEHGGPTSITIGPEGCDVGRRASMNWVLPDPARHISSHHFSVSFENGAYFLNDVSTNGTFLHGQSHRLDGPHRIGHGDRFTVGHYVIGADLSQQQMQPAAPATPSMLQTPPIGGAPAMDDSDPWDFGTPEVAVDPLPQRSNPRHLDDVAQDFVPAATPLPNPGVTSLPPGMPAGMPHSAPPAHDPYGGQYGGHHGGHQPGFQPIPQPQQPAPAPGGDALIRAFCEGAGLSPDAYHGVNAEQLARDMGRVVRNSTEDIMRMLQDRAAVKQFTKGGERTMRSATGNNPMKFLPDATQAIETMFLQHRDGFMTGPDGYQNALGDIRRHQTAVFAALQPALASLLSGLSPDEIEDSAGSGILGAGSRGKFWDAYVERWDTKSEAGDNGMLDAFLAAFAKAYMAAVGQAGD
jgi:type VI secretion system protein ImpI